MNTIFYEKRGSENDSPFLYTRVNYVHNYIGAQECITRYAKKTLDFTCKNM